MATDYEALAKLYGGKPADGPAMDPARMEQLAQLYGGKPSTPDPLTPGQAANAVATGFNRGVFAQLPGLVADTGANAIDLARAAYGALGRATGFLRPEDMPAPLDRSKVFGSSQYIADKLNLNPYTSAAITMQRPDVPAARVLNSGGTALGTSMAGTPGSMAMQFGSGTLGQGATELTGNPNWGMVASMTPQTALTAAQAGTRYAMRGGEAGRQEMAQRIQDFKNAGVTPTVGLATGNRVPQAIESALAKTPGGAGVIANKVQAIQDQLQGTANATRDMASPVYGPVAAGEAIRGGAQAYRTRQQAIYGSMLDRALGAVPQGMTFPVSNMLARGDAALADIPNAPNVSAVINQPRQFTAGLLGALEKDAAPQPATPVPMGLLDANGQPIMREAPASPGGLPMTGLLDLRRRVGELAYADNPLNADANTGALKSLYGGAKADIQGAGLLADQERVANGQAPAVSQGLLRADRFYTATQDVLDKVLAPLYKTAETSPERAYGRVESDSQNSGQNVQRLMSALPLDARRTVTATAIDRLGRARPGQQNAEGDAFSPQTFLTNYAKLSPEAKSGLFDTIPNGSAMRENLDHIAKAVERINGANKVYANPSGTAPAANLVGTAAGITSGLSLAATGHFGAGMTTMAGILGSMAFANRGAWLMANPKSVSWLAQSTTIKPEDMGQHLRRLATLANQETDPLQRAALQSFASDLSAELGR